MYSYDSVGWSFKDHMIFWKKDQIKQNCLQIKTTFWLNYVPKSSFIWLGMKFNFVGVKIDQFAHFQENHHQKERDDGLAATNFSTYKQQK